MDSFCSDHTYSFLFIFLFPFFGSTLCLTLAGVKFFLIINNIFLLHFVFLRQTCFSSQCFMRKTKRFLFLQNENDPRSQISFWVFIF